MLQVTSAAALEETLESLGGARERIAILKRKPSERLVAETEARELQSRNFKLASENTKLKDWLMNLPEDYYLALIVGDYQGSYSVNKPIQKGAMIEQIESLCRVHEIPCPVSSAALGELSMRKKVLQDTYDAALEKTLLLLDEAREQIEVLEQKSSGKLMVETARAFSQNFQLASENTKLNDLTDWLVKLPEDLKREIINENFDIPYEFRCPLSCRIMVDPVSAGDGNLYERLFIEKYFETSVTSPLTRQVLEDKNVYPCEDRKQKINAWIKDFDIAAEVCKLNPMVSFLVRDPQRVLLLNGQKANHEAEQARQNGSKRRGKSGWNECDDASDGMGPSGINFESTSEESGPDQDASAADWIKWSEIEHQLQMRDRVIDRDAKLDAVTHSDTFGWSQDHFTSPTLSPTDQPTESPIRTSRADTSHAKMRSPTKSNQTTELDGSKEPSASYEIVD